MDSSALTSAQTKSFITSNNNNNNSQNINGNAKETSAENQNNNISDSSYSLSTSALKQANKPQKTMSIRFNLPGFKRNEKEISTSPPSILAAQSSQDLLTVTTGTSEPVSSNPVDKKKVQLGKGFSLMDWVRLTKQSADLAGNKGIQQVITLDELAKHSTENDCWMAIQGKVYNVTPYMKFVII